MNPFIFWATAVGVPVVFALIVAFFVVMSFARKLAPRTWLTALVGILLAAYFVIVAFLGKQLLSGALLTALGAVLQVLAAAQWKQGKPYAEEGNDAELLRVVGWAVILTAAGVGICAAL